MGLYETDVGANPGTASDVRRPRPATTVVCVRPAGEVSVAVRVEPSYAVWHVLPVIVIVCPPPTSDELLEIGAMLPKRGSAVVVSLLVAPSGVVVVVFASRND